MTKPLLRLIAAAPIAAALSGCSYFGIDVLNQSDDKIQYEASNTRANLEVPPDLTQIPSDDRYQVPSRPSVVTATEIQAQQAQRSQEADKTPVSEVVKAPVKTKVMREGTMRWLRVNAPAEEVWRIAQDFWPSVGLTLESQDPKTGYMVTNWAENKARLPQDFIRNALGKTLDFLYSTGERDQYRVRLERNDDGGTDVFLTHRSMVEVVKGKEAETTVWQPGPADPTLEAEMLQRLALAIDGAYDPMLNVDEAKAELEKNLAQQTPESRSELVKDGDVLAAVKLKEGYDRAWRTVGLVIDRMGFELVDRDRIAGFFMVRYLDPAYEQAKRDERGFFSKVFGSEKAVDAPVYRIQLTDGGDATSITVLGADGEADATGVAPNILTLLAEQLR